MRLPGLLVFLLFFPLQVYLAIQLYEPWAWWLFLLTMGVIGFMGNRAARVPWIQQLLFPGHAAAREARRHVFQGILFLAGAILLYIHFGPTHDWLGVNNVSVLGVILLVTLVKSSVR